MKKLSCLLAVSVVVSTSGCGLLSQASLVSTKVSKPPAQLGSGVSPLPSSDDGPQFLTPPDDGDEEDDTTSEARPTISLTGDGDAYAEHLIAFFRESGIVDITRDGGPRQVAIVHDALGFHVSHLSHEDKYVTLSTGDAKTPRTNTNGRFNLTPDDAGGMRVKLQVPADATHLEFDRQFFSHESPTGTNNDTFEVKLLAGDATYVVDATDVATAITQQGAPGFSARHHVVLDLRTLAGQEIVLKFRVSDVGDTAGDSGVMIHGLGFGECPIHPTTFTVPAAP